MAESKELKSLSMNVTEESEKFGLKLNIQKTKIMASGPHHFMANRWGNSWEQWLTLFWGAPKSPQMKLKDTCSHEIKRHLILGRQVMTNLDSILKSRNITLLTKVNIVKATVFP